jgi:tRNA(Arg) A34 adenosine deaminase TadA
MGRKVDSDRKFLLRAIKLAERSLEPVGCGVVIVQHGTVLAEEMNSHWTDNIAVNHAEIKAVIAANKAIGSRTLPGAVAYCSCEPCAMCLTALSYAKVGRIVFHERMVDLNPTDNQSRLLDLREFAKKLSFEPKLEQLAMGLAG